MRRTASCTYTFDIGPTARASALVQRARNAAAAGSRTVMPVRASVDPGFVQLIPVLEATACDADAGRGGGTTAPCPAEGGAVGAGTGVAGPPSSALRSLFAA